MIIIRSYRSLLLAFIIGCSSATSWTNSQATGQQSQKNNAKKQHTNKKMFQIGGCCLLTLLAVAYVYMDDSSGKNSQKKSLRNHLKNAGKFAVVLLGGLFNEVKTEQDKNKKNTQTPSEKTRKARKTSKPKKDSTAAEEQSPRSNNIDSSTEPLPEVKEECHICLEEYSNKVQKVKLAPCNHTPACSGCAQQLIICPFCYKRVNTFEEIQLG